CVVEGRGQLEGAPMSQVQDRLYASLAERPGAHQMRASFVPQGAGHELCRARAVFVDQDHQRALGPYAPAMGFFRTQGSASMARRVDDPGAEELIGYGRRFAHQSSWIVPKIEEHSAQGSRLLPQFSQGLEELPVSSLLECLDAEVSHAVLHQDAAHTSHGDFFPSHDDIAQLLVARTTNGQA